MQTFLDTAHTAREKQINDQAEDQYSLPISA